MKYFKTKTAEGIKREYRELARKNHPDLGGDPEVMKEINLEYELACALTDTDPNEPEESSSDGSFADVYNRAWIIRVGRNYQERLTVTEIAKIVRTYAKEKYPMFKFSITKDTYCCIYIGLTAAAMSEDEAEYSDEVAYALEDIESFARSFQNYRDNPYDEFAYSNVFIHNYGVLNYKYKKDMTLRNKVSKYVAA